MSEYAREPRNYELMVILLPELVDEELTGAIDTITGHVTSIGAEVRDVLKDSPWGRRRLAYTVRFNGTDYRDGYYVIWHFSATPSSLGDLERELKLDVRVIRHLLVIEDPKWGSPQEREAARELANAPVVTPEAAAVTQAEEIVADAAVVEEAGEAAEVTEVIEAAAEAEGVEATEVVAEAAAVDEVVEAAEVAAEAPTVEEATEVVEAAEEVGEIAEVEEAVETVEAPEVVAEAASVEDAVEVAEAADAVEDEK